MPVSRPPISELEERVSTLERMVSSGVVKTVSSEGVEVQYRTMADLERALAMARRDLNIALAGTSAATTTYKTRRIIALR